MIRAWFKENDFDNGSLCYTFETVDEAHEWFILNKETKKQIIFTKGEIEFKSVIKENENEDSDGWVPY